MPFRILAMLIVGFTLIALAEKPKAPPPSATKDSLDRDYSSELPRIPAVEPNKALSTFKVHDGFHLDLVAAEPLVRDPIAMAFDENGRMFVVQMNGYSEEREDNRSFIQLLEDTDSDGVYDKSTPYVDGLAWPTAVACWDGGVFVADPPDILYCKDTNGDGRADTREKVFTGFGLSNVQGLLNTFLWGLDNQIHGATSTSGANVTLANDPKSVSVSLHGRDFAFDPRSRKLVAESGGAQHGMSFDDWGRKFVCSNSDHIQLVMFDDAYIARNPFLAAPGPRISIAADGPAADVFRISPIEPWRIVRTRLRVQGLVPGPIEGGGKPAGYFTGSTGVTIYKGDAWPAEYHGNAFIGDVGGNLVHRKTLEADGVELIARRADPGVEFIASTDIWFRPVQFANAPDGTLYISDMYREVIEHPESLPELIKKHLDLTSGRDRGRIYRIAPDGFKALKIPRLGDATSEQLVSYLEHPNSWQRETASRLLYQRQDKSVVPQLKNLALHSKSPLGRMQALHTLDGLGSLTPKTLEAALADNDPHVRSHAIKLSEAFVKDAPALRAKLCALTDDDDILVRYQLAFALGELADAPAAKALAQVARINGADEWFQLAILSSSVVNADTLFADLEGDSKYRSTDAGSKFLTQLAEQIGSAGRKEPVAAVMKGLDSLPQSEAALAQRIVRSMLDGIKKHGGPAKVQQVLAQSKIASGLLETLVENARVTAVDTGKPSDARVDAIETIGFDTFTNAKGILPKLLNPHEPDDVQYAALACLREFDVPEVASILLAAWPVLGPKMHTETLEALLSRKVWTLSLLGAIEDSSLNRANLDSNRIQSLRKNPDKEIQARATKVFGDYALSTRDEVIKKYQVALTLKGNRDHGKKLFGENCAQCHKLEGEGHEVGPELTTVAQAGPEKILTNVLDPNREVNPQYINYIVQTSDWESHTGLIASETSTSITLKRANAETDTVLRVSIDSIRSENQSLMPEGFEETLNPQALADLIAYITSVK